MHFILFHRPPPPENRFSGHSLFHKTESVLHPQIFIPRGEIARPFWSRQLSKSSRIVCEALYRPAEAPIPLSPLIERLPSPSLTAPFSTPPRIRVLALSHDAFFRKRRKTRGWIGDQLGIETNWTKWNDTTKGWTWLHWEWFCSKIYPLLRLSFLKTYLILSGKLWNCVETFSPAKSVLLFCNTERGKIRGWSIEKRMKWSYEKALSRDNNFAAE